MKVYKLEILVIDHENSGADSIQFQLETNRYISPHIMSCEDVEIGEWSDDHPLNKRETFLEEYKRLFNQVENESERSSKE